MVPREYARSDGRRVQVESNFWRKVDKTGECWVWTGSKHSFGYGHFRVQGVLLRAHRITWEWVFGEIPSGMCVLHRCDNPSCVRPDHLFLGTKKDNSVDMASKGRSAAQLYPERVPRGEQSSRAKLTEDQVVLIRTAYAARSANQYELAAEYGVSQPAIGMILRRRNWKHV